MSDGRHNHWLQIVEPIGNAEERNEIEKEQNDRITHYIRLILEFSYDDASTNDDTMPRENETVYGEM